MNSLRLWYEGDMDGAPAVSQGRYGLTLGEPRDRIYRAKSIWRGVRVDDRGGLENR